GAAPGAVNWPADAIVDPGGRLRPASALAAAIAERGADARPVIATCGSGVTACLVALALAVLGREDWRVYDGSWAEWGRETNDPDRFPVIAAAIEGASA
ncbi:MAG: rhodanese-like domain-containing protein, partial [Pseudomonadota bacterium]